MCGHLPMKVSACFVYKEADLRSFYRRFNWFEQLFMV